MYTYRHTKISFFYNFARQTHNFKIPSWRGERKKIKLNSPHGDFQALVQSGKNLPCQENLQIHLKSGESREEVQAHENSEHKERFSSVFNNLG